MAIRLRGKRVDATACAQAIGLIITEAFAVAGAQMHICDGHDDVFAAATSCFPQARQSRTNVLSEVLVDALFAELKARWAGAAISGQCLSLCGNVEDIA